MDAGSLRPGGHRILAKGGGPPGPKGRAPGPCDGGALAGWDVSLSGVDSQTIDVCPPDNESFVKHQTTRHSVPSRCQVTTDKRDTNDRRRAKPLRTDVLPAGMEVGGDARSL